MSITCQLTGEKGECHGKSLALYITSFSFVKKKNVGVASVNYGV